MTNHIMAGNPRTSGHSAELSFGASALNLVAVIGYAVCVFRSVDPARYRSALRTFEPTIRSLEKLIATEPQEFSASERKSIRGAICRLREGSEPLTVAATAARRAMAKQ